MQDTWLYFKANGQDIVERVAKYTIDKVKYIHWEVSEKMEAMISTTSIVGLSLNGKKRIVFLFCFVF